MIDDRTLWMGEIEPWMTEEYISKLFPNARIKSIIQQYYQSEFTEIKLQLVIAF